MPTSVAQRLDSLGADVQRIDAWLKEGFAARDADALCKGTLHSSSISC